VPEDNALASAEEERVARSKDLPESSRHCDQVIAQFLVQLRSAARYRDGDKPTVRRKARQK